MKSKTLWRIYVLLSIAAFLLRLLFSGAIDYLPCAHSLYWGFDTFVAVTLFEERFLMGGIVLVLSVANMITFVLSAIYGNRGHSNLRKQYILADIILSSAILIAGVYLSGELFSEYLFGTIINIVYFMIFVWSIKNE